VQHKHYRHVLDWNQVYKQQYVLYGSYDEKKVNACC